MLLDTNAFLFLLRGDARVTRPLSAVIANPALPLKLSLASFWELTIKHRKGKLPMPAPFSSDPRKAIENWAARAGIDLVEISIEHIAQAMKLKFDHDDPFDRIIAATALVEKMELVTSDRSFAACPGLKLVQV